MEEHLLDRLKKQYPDSSAASLRKKIAAGRVFINNKAAYKAKIPVEADDSVTVGQKIAMLCDEVPILYEDSHIIVVEKPKGLLSVDTPTSNASLHTKIKKARSVPVVYPVHRLDRDTSGLIVFALTPAARDGLKEQIEQRAVSRVYISQCHGKFQQRSGSVSGLLFEDKNHMVHMGIGKGKESLSYYEVIAYKRKTTIVRWKLHTGRKHQIRLHAKSLGHPIVGDRKYASAGDGQKLMLHAAKLTFTHPITGKKCEFSSKGFYEAIVSGQMG